MKKQYLYISTIITIAFLSITSAYSQDAHLSQYFASPILLNPASTGMYEDGNLRAAALYRSQWGSMGSKFSTSTLAFDMPIYERWGIGGYLLNDDAAKVFNSFNFVVSGAYEITTPNNGKHKLTTGLQLGFIYKKTNLDRLYFDSQYQDGNFDSDLPNGESFEKNSTTMPEVNLGFNYVNTDKTLWYNPYGGITVMHCSYPKESFVSTEDSHLPLRFVLNAGSLFEINDQLKLDPSILLMKQRNNIEFNGGLRAYYNITNAEIKVIGGCFFRLHDAVIPMLGLEYRYFKYMISYDINISDLNNYSGGHGGLEFSLIFTGSKSRGSSLL